MIGSLSGRTKQSNEVADNRKRQEKKGSRMTTTSTKMVEENKLHEVQFSAVRARKRLVNGLDPPNIDYHPKPSLSTYLRRTVGLAEPGSGRTELARLVRDYSYRGLEHTGRRKSVAPGLY